jgi:hypothetical protein
MLLGFEVTVAMDVIVLWAGGWKQSAQAGRGEEEPE